jgi:hypothetical protein
VAGIVEGLRTCFRPTGDGSLIGKIGISVVTLPNDPKSESPKTFDKSFASFEPRNARTDFRWSLEYLIITFKQRDKVRMVVRVVYDLAIGVSSKHRAEVGEGLPLGLEDSSI